MNNIRCAAERKHDNKTAHKKYWEVMIIVMKKNIVKRLMALLIVTGMTLNLLAGCGQDEGETSESPSSKTQESSTESIGSASPESGSGTESGEADQEEGFVHDPNLSEPGTQPICKEKVKLTVGVVQNTNVENYDTNWYTQMLKEEANVDLEFYYFPSQDYTQKLSMMCNAGGDDLPDILLMNLKDGVVSEYGQAGMLIPLDEYYENSSYYFAEGFKRVLDTEGINILENIRSADGHIYTVSQYTVSVTNPCYTRIWVYKPWLEKLQIEEPKTTEEFKKMLEAFKTLDPNGNGKADEIPALGSDITKQAGTGSWFWEAMMNAFVRTNSRNNFLDSKDHKLSVPYVTEEWKEGVKFIRSLCEEGLFDPVSFSQDDDTFKTVMNKEGDQIVGAFCFLTTSFIGKNHASKGNWVLLEPLTGPEGVCTTSYLPDLPNEMGYISKNCQNPEAAFRLLDLMGREDFTITSRWGKEGENWDYVDNIKDSPEYADMDFSHTFMDYPSYIYEHHGVWNTQQNSNWQNKTPSFRTAEVAAGYFASIMTEGSDNYEMAYKLGSYEAVKPKEIITKFAYTVEEEKEVTEIANSLNSYVREKIALWCTGAEDVDKAWDSYLQELENIGLSKYLEMTQAAYDRN